MRYFRCSLPYPKGPSASTQTLESEEGGKQYLEQLRRARRATIEQIHRNANISNSSIDTQAAISTTQASNSNIQTLNSTEGRSCYKPEWCPCQCKLNGTTELECKCETMDKWHCAVNITGEFAAPPQQRMTCGLIINTILACNITLTLRLICASLNVKLCTGVFKSHFT